MTLWEGNEQNDCRGKAAKYSLRLARDQRAEEV